MSDTAPDKWRCEYWRCAWGGTLEQALSAPDPFNEGDMMYACPKCRTTTLVRACDIQDCNEIASCGTPVDDARRYVHVCGDHYREITTASKSPDQPEAAVK